jgi:superfamily I DNA/RNA helicase
LTLPVPVGAQKEVVALEPRGHIAVLGTAGSGKTTMAIHRAVAVSNPRAPNSGRTLLLTFNTTLLRYLDHLVPAELTARLTVENYHAFARGYLASRGRMSWNCIVRDGAARRALIEQAANAVFQGDGEHPLRDRSADFLSDEITWMSHHGVVDRESYREADRIGRHEARLANDERDPMFDIYEEYRRQRAAAGKLYDWEDIAISVREELEADDTARRYRHIVIDEGQDFSPEMIRSLVLAIPLEGSLTFFGDVAQQIYGRRISWQDAGLNITKPWLFKKNYRNTKEIADLALAIAAMPYYSDEPDMVSPDEFRAAGPRPTLVRFETEADEVAFVVEQAKAAAAAGQSVAVIVRRQRDARRFSRELRGSQLLGPKMTWKPGAGISCGTIHAAKGLEFDTVYLPFLTTEHLPDPVLVDVAGRDEAEAIDGRLLYVAVTRARQNLVLTSSSTLTTLMPEQPSLWTDVAP